MKLTHNQFTVLRFIANHSNVKDRLIINLKSQFDRFPDLKLDLQQVLIDIASFIVIINDEVSLSDQGTKFIEEFDLYEIELIRKGYLDFVIIKFIKEQSYPLSATSPSSFPKSIINSLPVPNGKSSGNMNDLTYYLDNNLRDLVRNIDSKGFVITENGEFYLNTKLEEIKREEKTIARKNFDEDINNQIRQLTLDNLTYQKRNENLNKLLSEKQVELAEAQTKFINKRPSWKERNWLWLAITGFIIGYAADISKEVIKHTMYPEKTESKSPTPVKRDSTRR